MDEQPKYEEKSTSSAGGVLGLSVALGTLLPVFCLLFGAARAVRARDIFFLFGFGFHLIVARLRFGCCAKHQARLDDFVNIAHEGWLNGGTISRG